MDLMVWRSSGFSGLLSGGHCLPDSEEMSVRGRRPVSWHDFG